MRRWFLNQETELLRNQFLHFSKDRKDFFDYYKDEFNFSMVTISDEDLQVGVCNS